MLMILFIIFIGIPLTIYLITSVADFFYEHKEAMNKDPEELELERLIKERRSEVINTRIDSSLFILVEKIFDYYPLDEKRIEVCVKSNLKLVDYSGGQERYTIRFQIKERLFEMIVNNAWSNERMVHISLKENDQLLFEYNPFKANDYVQAFIPGDWTSIISDCSNTVEQLIEEIDEKIKKENKLNELNKKKEKFGLK